MLLRVVYFVTLLLAGLNMGPTFCHTLEMPVKMEFSYSQYLTAQHIYEYFGTAGAILEPGAILSAAALTFLIRDRRPSFRLALAGTILLALALVVWFVFVAPMNAEMMAWTAGSVPPNWSRVRTQWEYGHAASFVLQLIGFGLLVGAVLVDMSPARPSSPAEA